MKNEGKNVAGETALCKMGNYKASRKAFLVIARETVYIGGKYFKCSQVGHITGHCSNSGKSCKMCGMNSYLTEKC